MRDHIEELHRELTELISLRTAQGWDKYWRDCMRFALPQDVSYDTLLLNGSLSAVTNTAMHTPTASQSTKTLYDQTSLWAIERLTAGLISLKTPEAGQWHKLTVDDPFGYEPTQEEEAWFDRLNRYIFKVRSNPRSGFWPTHKAAVRSTAAMGDGFFFQEEKFGEIHVPWSYEFVPLGECYLSVDMAGQTLRFYRLRKLTAEQIVKKWPDTAPTKVKNAASDPQRRNEMFDIAHAITPRDDQMRAKRPGVFGAPLAGVYFDLETKTMLAETGYYEMPYHQHSWNKTAGRAYSEGPMALALAEVKSLNEMSKNELISSQQAVRPPLAVFGDATGMINLNPGKINKGLISGDGKMLAQPIMTHTRPDFAQQVIETRRNNVREMLYLNLWQILINTPNMTATEALLRSQEKGDLLGPVGISFNHSLSGMLDREIAILARKGAFEEGSPLAAPESIAEKNIMPSFTSPLDRMRNLEEVIGAQRTVAGMMEVAALKPEIMERLDVDRYSDLLRRGNGAPADLFLPAEAVQQNGSQQDQMEQLAQVIELAKAGGDAAGALGGGIQQLQGAAGGGGGLATAGGPAAAVQGAVAA